MQLAKKCELQHAGKKGIYKMLNISHQNNKLSKDQFHMHTSCNLKSMVLKIPNPLNSCERSMLHNHTSVGIIGDNTDIHWASLPYITPGNHGKK